MDRARQGTSVAVRVTLTVDEVPTDPDSQLVTVSATRLNGAVVFTAQTATRVSAGVYQMAATTAHTALLDTLTLAWSYARSGATMVEKTYLEVVGGFIVSLAELRKRLPDVTTYPLADILTMRTDAEQAVEEACGVAFVPRYAYEALSVNTPTQRVRLEHARPRVVREVKIGTVSYTQTQLDQLLLNVNSQTVDLYGSLIYQNGSIGYEHGYDFPPRPVVDAVLDAATFYAGQTAGVTQNIDPRATRIITQDGTVELGGARGVTGLATVDSVIKRYRQPLIA
jgi:hypothetical protein